MNALHRVDSQIHVSYRYPVLFTRDVFAETNSVLAETLRACGGQAAYRTAVYVDENVLAAHPELPRRLQAYSQAHGNLLHMVCPPLAVPGGEAAKNRRDLLETLLDEMLEHHLCRQSIVIAIGGGAVLDAVGLAAALTHRGVRLVRLPTTVLAQNDVGVGVKNGINYDGIKNAIGVFAPPFCVINDLDFLSTLPDEHWISGVSEAFKVAVLKEATFFHFLCGAADALRRREADAMDQTVIRCADLHLQHIAEHGDPFEFGAARPLDFGHWAAHQLESMSGYRVPHGHAVAAGIALDSLYAQHRGWLAEKDASALLDALRRCGFRLWHPEFETRRANGRRVLFEGIEKFREHLGGDLCVTYPNGLGKKREEHALDEALLERVLDLLYDAENSDR